VDAHRGRGWAGRNSAALALAVLLCAPPATAAAQEAPAADSLDTLLVRAGRYVSSFEAAFTSVVGFERYRQEVHAPSGGDMADLESEVFFVGLDAQRTGLTVRHVLTVNGRTVAGSGESVIDLLAGNGNRARLRELADASARYNIGRLHRNFNDPTLALSFLAPAAQKRFRFEDAGRDTVAGVEVRRIAFDEHDRPTIVRDGRTRRDAPSSGLLFVDEHGRVMRSELRVRVPGRATSLIRVSYGYEPRLEMLVPRLMEEEYRTSGPAGAREWIACRATYSDYRRFETAGRILTPDDASGDPR
jgi:hypothetical protein